MIPVWTLLLVVAILVLPLAAISYLHFVRNPVPFPDHGNSVFVCPDAKSRTAFLNVLKCFGLTPDKQANSAFTHRAIFLKRHRFIVNFTEPETWSRMGTPRAGVAIVVRNPAKCADNARQMLDKLGHEVTVLNDPDSDVPGGSLSILTSEAFPGLAVIFRRHLLKMGPPPPKWVEDSSQD